jgi:hypothetical protein
LNVVATDTLSKTASAHVRIDLVQALQVGLLLRRRVVADPLVVHRRDLQVVPGRLRHALPRAERFQPELEQPLGLALDGRQAAHDLLVQAGGKGVGLDDGLETVLVLACGELFDCLRRSGHGVRP